MLASSPTGALHPVSSLYCHRGIGSVLTKHGTDRAPRSIRNRATVIGHTSHMVGVAEAGFVVEALSSFVVCEAGTVLVRVLHGIMAVSLLQDRQKNSFAFSMPLHDRLQLEWDAEVTAELASRQMLGGYSGGFARQGASKCTEAVEQMIDLLETVECPSDSTWQKYRIRKGHDPEERRSSGAFNLEIECVAASDSSESKGATGHEEM